MLKSDHEDEEIEGYFDPDMVIEAYLSYRDKNLLPFDGGVLEQPNGLLDGLRLIDRMVSWWLVENERDDPDELPSWGDFMRLKTE